MSPEPKYFINFSCREILFYYRKLDIIFFIVSIIIKNLNLEINKHA